MGDISFVQWVLGVAGSLAALYVAAWVVSRAVFDNKVQYNKRLLRHLEEHD